MSTAARHKEQEEEDGEDAVMGPTPIEMMEQMGVNASDVAKLKAGGMFTMEAVAYATMKSLTNLKGVSEVRML